MKALFKKQQQATAGEVKLCIFQDICYSIWVKLDFWHCHYASYRQDFQHNFWPIFELQAPSCAEMIIALLRCYMTGLHVIISECLTYASLALCSLNSSIDILAHSP